jgi:hypothetical protein
LTSEISTAVRRIGDNHLHEQRPGIPVGTRARQIFGQRQFAPSLGIGHDDGGIQHEQRGGRVGGGRAVGHVAAERRQVANREAAAGARCSAQQSSGESLDLGRGFEFGHGSSGADHTRRASRADVIQAGPGDIDQEADRVIALNYHVRTAGHYPCLALAAVEQSKCFADTGRPVKSFDLIEHINLRGR